MTTVNVQLQVMTVVLTSVLLYGAVVWIALALYEDMRAHEKLHNEIH